MGRTWARRGGVSPLQAFTYSPTGDLLATHTYTNGADYITETYAYDMLGNRIATTNALGNTTYRTYDPLGNLTAEWGATYPVRYTYDTQGRRTSLTTFRTTGAVALVATGGDTTTWTYDPYTSLCTSKTYADGSIVTYTYTPDNLLLRTTYASGKWKENVYDFHRRLCGVVYSSPDMDYELQLDDYGRTVLESNSVCSVAYELAEVGTATNEVASIGDEAISIARTLDGQDRLEGLAVPDSGYEAIYAYAVDGNIENISNDLACVSYLYSSNRLDVGYSIRLANGTTIQRNLYRDDFRRSLVTNITTVVNGNNVESLDYSFDAASRPIARNDDTFGYNARNEVVSATIGGNSETHEYDDIGNSLRATFNAVANTFAVNNLNQYTSISRNAVPLLEASHDIDGNMTQCGAWAYAYDAGHQLKSVSLNGVLLVTNYYDAKSRRVRKVTPDATITFFYDDWNLIEERIAYASGTTSTIHYYWGKDLSGTLQGAGGVGGLLYLTVDGAIYIPCYDNNGNVTRYLDANGNSVAQYTYDAFGNIIFNSGPLADFFRHRFSTKYYDAETGLCYYGYRFYHPGFMRWFNRDLMGEDGGTMLYGMCANNPLVGFDVFGLYELTLISDRTTDGYALMWFLHGNAGNTIRSDIHFQKELFEVIARENFRRGNMVTVLNLSGHGLGLGSGIRFANGTEFDVGQSYEKLKPFLAPNATIKIWSCHAASTSKKCSNLRKAAEVLDATIYANTGTVMAGPDGNAITRTTRRIVAWVMKANAGEWKRFTPLPKIRARGYVPGPRAFRIMKEERKLND